MKTAARGFFMRSTVKCMLLIAAFLEPLPGRAAETLFENNQAFNALEAAWKDWKSSVEFKGNYVLRRGTAESQEAALEGRFGSAAGDPKGEYVYTGVFDKLGDEMRFSREFKPDSNAAEMKKKARAESFDEISTVSLALCSKLGGDDLLYATVGPRPDSLAGMVVTGTFMSIAMQPFSGGYNGLNGTLREFLAPRPGFNEKVVESSVVKPDNGHIEIKVVKTFQNDSDTISTRIKFRTDTLPPVIERIEIVEDLPSRKIKQTDITSFEDFVQCKGGKMPRTFRGTFGPAIPIGKTKAIWTAHEWKSANLGEAPPTPEDFVYVAPLDSSIVGLNVKVPIVDGKYHLDLAKYSTSDFLKLPNGLIVAVAQNPPQSKESKPHASLVPRLLLFGSGVIFVVLLVLVIRKRRHLRTA
jgi:hypothetical protein